MDQVNQPVDNAEVTSPPEVEVTEIEAQVPSILDDKEPVIKAPPRNYYEGHPDAEAVPHLKDIFVYLSSDKIDIKPDDPIIEAFSNTGDINALIEVLKSKDPDGYDDYAKKIQRAKDHAMTHVEYARARRTNNVNEVFGSTEAWNEATAWAAKNLSEEQQEAIDKMLRTKCHDLAKEKKIHIAAANMLKDLRAAATTKETSMITEQSQAVQQAPQPAPVTAELSTPMVAPVEASRDDLLSAARAALVRNRNRVDANLFNDPEFQRVAASYGATADYQQKRQLAHSYTPRG